MKKIHLSPKKATEEKENIEALNLSNFWEKDYRKVYCSSDVQGKSQEWPSLNGKTDINDVRDLIQDGLKSIKVPLPQDVDCLQMYLNDLIVRGWMKQARVILKFLYRYWKFYFAASRANDLNRQSHNVFMSIEN